MSSLRLHPNLLLHVHAISARWDDFATSQFLQQPHSYPNLVRLGALTLEWWTAGGWIPKVIGLAKRFPSLVELRINLLYVDNEVDEDSVRVDTRSPSLVLPKTLRKLSVSGPDGFVPLDALTKNSLPHLVEFELETFGNGTSHFFTSEEGRRFFQKFGKNLTSLSLSPRFVKQEGFSLLDDITHSPHDPCPAYIFSLCPSLKTVVIQGLGLDQLLIQGHRTLETVEFGLIAQPHQIASGLEIIHHVDLYSRLNSFLHYFDRNLFPLLRKMRVASLDFRQASSRNWITLQGYVPRLIDQGIFLFDFRGVQWVDVEKGASWPSEVLVETKERFIDLDDKLFREGIVFRAAERFLRGNDENQGEDENDGDGGEVEKEEEKSMPPGMAEALEAGMEELLKGLEVAMEETHLQHQREMEIMEENDLIKYVDTFAEEEMEKKGKKMA